MKRKGARSPYRPLQRRHRPLAGVQAGSHRVPLVRIPRGRRFARCLSGLSLLEARRLWIAIACPPASRDLPEPRDAGMPVGRHFQLHLIRVCVSPVSTLQRSSAPRFLSARSPFCFYFIDLGLTPGLFPAPSVPRALLRPGRTRRASAEQSPREREGRGCLEVAAKQVAVRATVGRDGPR